MAPRDARIGLWVFLVLMMGAATNLFFFQGLRRTAGGEIAARVGERAAQSLRETPQAIPEPREARAAVPAPSPAPPRTTGSLPLLGAGADKAEITRGVQRELNTRGYGTGQPDGVPGLITRAAIMAYEFDYGLTLTAEPSEELLKRIVLGTSGPVAVPKNPPLVKGAEAESVIKQVKQSLTGLGYASGKADGKLSDEAVRAIRDFENDEKMPETGRISAQLVSRLIKRQAQGQTGAQARSAAR